MDFTKKEINGSFLKPIFLVLLILPMMLSMSNDCAGKAFHCLNNTHFTICVEVGNGITTIVDNLEIPCPSGTQCHSYNTYQCELTPSPTLVPHVKDETETTTTSTTSIERKEFTKTLENDFNQQESLPQYARNVTEKQQNNTPTSISVNKYVTPEDVTMNTIAFVTLSYTHTPLLDNKFTFEDDSRPEGKLEELNKSHDNDNNISSNEKTWDHLKDKSRVNFTTEVTNFTNSVDVGHNNGNVIYGSETLHSTSSIPSDINILMPIINYTNTEIKYTTNQESLIKDTHKTTPPSLISAVEDQSEIIVLEANTSHIFVPELESSNLLQTVTDTYNQETSKRDITMLPILKISTDKISESSTITKKLIKMEKEVTGSYKQDTVIKVKTTNTPSLMSAVEDQSKTVQLDASTSHIFPDLEYFTLLQTVTETNNQETSKRDITLSPIFKISKDKISESSIITEKSIEMKKEVTDLYEQENVIEVKATPQYLISAVEDKSNTDQLEASTSHMFVPKLDSSNLLQTVTETYNQETSKRDITLSPILKISTDNISESSIITKKLIEKGKEINHSYEQEPVIDVKTTPQSLMSAVEYQSDIVLLEASTSHIFVPELDYSNSLQSVTETYNQETSKHDITISPLLKVSTDNISESSVISKKLIEMGKEVADSYEQEPVFSIKTTPQSSISAVEDQSETVLLETSTSHISVPELEYSNLLQTVTETYNQETSKRDITMSSTLNMSLVNTSGLELKDTTTNDMTNPIIKVKMNEENISNIVMSVKLTTPIIYNFTSLPAEVNSNDNNYTQTWPISTDEIRDVYTKSKEILLGEVSSHTDQDKISITEKPKTFNTIYSVERDQFNENKLSTAIQDERMNTEDQEYINNYDITNSLTVEKMTTKAEEKPMTVKETQNVKEQINSFNEVNIVSAANSKHANTKYVKVTNGFYITTPLNEVKSNIVTMDTKVSATTNTYDLTTSSDELQLSSQVGNTVTFSDLSQKTKFHDERDENTVAGDQQKWYKHFNNTQMEYGAILINGQTNVPDEISEIFQSSESIESKEIYEPSSKKSDITEILNKNLYFYPRNNSMSLNTTRYTTYDYEVTTTNNMLVSNSYLEAHVNTKEQVPNGGNKYIHEFLTTTVTENTIYDEQNKEGTIKSNITNSLPILNKNIETSHIKTEVDNIDKLANTTHYKNQDIKKPFSEQVRNNSYEQSHVTLVESSFVSSVLTPETYNTKSFNEDKIIINKPTTENTFKQNVKTSSSQTLITPTTPSGVIGNLTNNIHGVTGDLVDLDNIKKVVDMKSENVSTTINNPHNIYSHDIYISTESPITVTTHHTVYQIQSDRGDRISKTTPNYENSKTSESLRQVASSSTLRPKPTIHAYTKTITVNNNEPSTLFPKLITKNSIRKYVATQETQIPSYSININPIPTISWLPISNIPSQESIERNVKENIDVETKNKHLSKNISEKWDEDKIPVSMNSSIENSNEKTYLTQKLYITTTSLNKPSNVSNQLGYRTNSSSSSVNETGYIQTMRNDKTEESNSNSYMNHTTNSPYSTFTNKDTKIYNFNKSFTNDQSFSKDTVNQTLTNNSSSINCENQNRGKFADLYNCRKYHVCIGKFNPMVRYCPNNTVFSDIKKQCTTNLSHCVRNNSFQCIKEGRFSDYFDNNAYYICVQKQQNHFYRLKFQCRNGYYLDKITVTCVVNIPVRKSNQSSKSSSIENKSIKGIVENSSKTKLKNNDNSSNEDVDFKCHHEGQFSYPGNCRKYYICKIKKGALRRKKKKCNRYKVFDKKHMKCVDSESYECND